MNPEDQIQNTPTGPTEDTVGLPASPVPQQGANPLAAIAESQQDKPIDLLKQIEVDKTAAVEADPETLARRSGMHAVANMLDNPEKGSVFDNYSKALQHATSAIALNGEYALRAEAELTALNSAVGELSRLANTPTGNPEDQHNAKMTLAKTLQEKAAQQAKTASERKWAESVTAMRDNGDLMGAEWSIMQHNTPDVLDNMIDVQTTRALFLREIEDAQVKTENRNALLWLTDLLSFFPPFGTTAAYTRTFSTQDEGLLDFIMPGKNFREAQANAQYLLANAKTEDEKKEIIKTIVGNINTNVSTFLGPNEMLRLQLLADYTAMPSADLVNLNAAVQNVPILGAAAYKGIKALYAPYSLSNVLKGFGATTKQKQLIEAIANTIKTEGVDVAKAKFGVNAIDEAVEGLTPPPLNPNAIVFTEQDPALLKYEINKRMDAIEADDSLLIHEKEKLLGDLRRELEEISKGNLPPVPPLGQGRVPYGQAPVDMTAPTGGVVNPLNMGAGAAEVVIKGANLPKAANPAPGYYGSVATPAAEALENGELVLQQLVGDLQIIQRLDDTDKAKVVADMAERAETMGIQEASRKRVVIEPRMETKVTGAGSEINLVYMTIGKAARKNDKSMWYADKATAEQKARQLGFGLVDDAKETSEVLKSHGSAKVVQIGERQWGIEIGLPVDETGKSLGGARMHSPLADKLRAGPFAGLARYLAGAAGTQSKSLIGAAHLSFDKANKIVKAIEQHIIPKFYKISNEERDVLGAVLVKGERDKVWYTEHELEVFYKANFGTKADPTKFVDAYWAAKDINDIEYYLRNATLYTELSSQGYQKVFIPKMFGDKPLTGKIYRNFETLPDEAIWDVDLGLARVGKNKRAPTSRYRTADRLTEQDLVKKLEDGHVLVKLDEPEILADGAVVRYFLTKGENIKADALAFRQIPYYPGGHRMYKANYFVKKARGGQQPWKEDYLRSPFTPTASLTRAEGLEWANNANRIQDAYNAAVKQGLQGNDLEIAVQKAIDNTDSALGYPNADEFIDWMKKHGSEHPFEVVADRELPTLYSGSNNYSKSGGWGEKHSGITTYMSSQGKMYSSRKGEILPNIRDWEQSSEVYDPFTTLNTAMSQIAKLTSFTDFKLRGVHKWVATYGNAIDMQGIEGANPMRIFLEGKFRTGTNELQSVKAAAELQRAIIKRQLGWKSDFDLATENSMRKVAEWVAGDKPGARAKLAHGAVDWWLDKKPISALQNMAYDATMGLFNVAQFPLQLTSSWVAASIDLTKGTQAMGNVPFILVYLRKGAGNGESTLKHLVERGVHKLAGFEDPEEYMRMMRLLKKTGYADSVLGTLRNEHGPNAAMGMVGRGIQQARNAGRFFAHKAEEINKLNSFQMAFKMVKERYPGIDDMSPLFAERTRTLASTLNVNMDEASAAAWQRNIVTRIPTQFMPFMARWHELLLSKDLTLAQRARFVIGQAFMYGRAGIPFAAYFLAENQKNEGKAPKMGTPEGIVDRGFADTMIWYITGADVSFSSRAGIGMAPTDLIQEFFGGGRYGDASAASLATGAMGSIWGTIWDASYETFKYAALETGHEDDESLGLITERALKRLARSVASVNNLMKAELIFNYGEYTNRKGEVIVDELPSVYGVAAMFGLEPGELQDLTAQRGFLSNRKDRVDQWTEALMINRTEFSRAMRDGDYGLARELEATAFTLGALMPKDIKRDVFTKAYDNPITRTVAESIGERYEKEASAAAFIKRNEKN